MTGLKLTGIQFLFRVMSINSTLLSTGNDHRVHISELFMYVLIIREKYIFAIDFENTREFSKLLRGLYYYEEDNWQKLTFGLIGILNLY